MDPIQDCAPPSGDDRGLASPYILAVKDRTKSDILTNFKAHRENSTDEEFAETLRQIERIAFLRLTSVEGLA